MRRFIAFLLIVPLFISSCSKAETPESLYSNGMYIEAIALADSILSSSLDYEALYYKAASYFSLKVRGEAEEAATLYLLLDSDGEFRNEALYIIFLTGSDNKSIKAGEELRMTAGLSHSSLVRLCFLYAYNDMDTEFSRLYREIRGELTDEENAFLLIAEGRDLSMIFMALDSLLEDGIDPSDELLEAAEKRFIEKGQLDLFQSYVSSRGIAFTTVV